MACEISGPKVSSDLKHCVTSYAESTIIAALMHTKSVE